MTCKDIQHRIKPFFDDLLTENDYQAVCAHLDACDRCRQYAASTSSLSYVLRELGDLDVPRDLRASVRFHLEDAGRTSVAAPGRQDKKSLFTSRIFKFAGFSAGALVVAGFIMFNNGRKVTQAPGMSGPAAVGVDETPTVQVEINKKQAPLSDREAEELYKQLQVMADSLEQAAGIKDKTAETPPAGSGQHNGPAPDPPSAVPAVVRAADEPAPEIFSFHWHVPYSRDTQREQLMNTVQIFGINPGYQDEDFLIFTATGSQLKLLVEGVQFSNQTALDVSRLAQNGTFAGEDIPVIIHFIKHVPYAGESSSLPIVKKDGVFVSYEEAAPAGADVLDWHVLMVPAQRDLLLNAVGAAGGKILYSSEDAVVFSAPGPGIEKLQDEIRGIGGVFADFGQKELGANTLIKESVKVLIYFKRQEER